MNRCKICRDNLVLAFYHELSDDVRTEFEQHITGCKSCRAAYQHLKKTLGFMAQREQPDPGNAFWDGFWGDVNVKIQHEKIKPVNRRAALFQQLKNFIPRLNRPIVLQGFAVAATLVVGIFIGKYFFADDVKVPQLTDPSQRTTLIPAELQSQTRSYLEESQLLLMGIANFDLTNEDPFILDINAKKTRSRNLAARAAELKPALSDARATRLVELITDLELILLQLANLEEEQELDAIEFVQDAIDQQSIFLKINMEELRKTLQTQPASTSEKSQSRSQI